MKLLCRPKFQQPVKTNGCVAYCVANLFGDEKILKYVNYGDGGFDSYEEQFMINKSRVNRSVYKGKKMVVEILVDMPKAYFKTGIPIDHLKKCFSDHNKNKIDKEYEKDYYKVFPVSVNSKTRKYLTHRVYLFIGNKKKFLFDPIDGYFFFKSFNELYNVYEKIFQISVICFKTRLGNTISFHYTLVSIPI